MTTFKVVKLGAKFPGACVVCGSRTGERDFELADTVLLQGPDGYGVAHARCCGARLKSKVGGRRVAVGLPETVDTP